MLAFVLSARDWREYDKMVSLYTLENGKVEAMAKGVKKITAKNSAYLMPFCFIEAEIVAGREIGHLTKAAPTEMFPAIRSDLAKSLAAGYAMALLDKIIQTGEADKKIFDLVKSWLGYLEEVKFFPPVILDAFVAKLFYLLGFDISASNKYIPIRKELGEIVKGSWPLIAGLALDERLRPRIHRAIVDFATYHSEKKLGDWGKFLA